MQKRNAIKTILLLTVLFIFINLSAQNVGIGTSEPQEKLQVNGNLLIQQPYTFTNTAPTVAQTKTMVNGSNTTFLNTDSTGRIYDPGGPAGNYLDNLTATATIPCCATNNNGIEINIEDINLNSFDSVIITDNNGTIVFKVGNGYNTISKTIYNTNSLTITFKSNNDGLTGRGFDISFKRLYILASTPGSNSAFGNALYFDAGKGIFRAGYLSRKQKGDYSTALGHSTAASGFSSTASGSSTDAIGDYSTALGSSTDAIGDYSTAIGNSTTASGYSSTALGNITTASGSRSTAMGYSATASGDYSTAMGYLTDAIGEYSTALGYSTTASGYSCTALGYSTTASGYSCTALGSFTTASGFYSTAIGRSTTASGYSSIASGYSTTASGDYSTALGNSTTAGGDYSFSVGYKVTAAQKGSFFFGDSDPDNEGVTANGSPDEFVSRFKNGYYFMTSGGNNNDGTPRTGVRVLPGGNSWSAISDVRLKENFEPVDGESFLRKIGAMPQYTWNYKGQNALTYRHYGPMAQDFYKAFGKDKYGSIGCDTLINQQDFLGVNLVAIQALVKRTEILIKETEALNKKTEILSKENAELKQELADLKKTTIKQCTTKGGLPCIAKQGSFKQKFVYGNK